MPYDINNQHQLVGDGVTLMQAAKNKDTFKQKLPDTIIIHYTAGASAESSAKYLARDDVEASAHLVIGRKGEVYQLVPFNIQSWHAGISNYQGRSGFNQYSIGIELDNAGKLTKSGSTYISDFGRHYPEHEVVFGRHRNQQEEGYWHTYTELQIERCEEICQKLITTYMDISTILGHEEISPGRKIDPGPAFPLDMLRNRLMQNRKDDKLAAKGKVVATKLNIRDQPEMSGRKVALPLEKGTDVQILEEYNGWYRVSTKIEGWVSKAYVQRK